MSEKRRENREIWALMVVDVLRNVMNIFYGPFLAMYFFKISADAVGPVSVYNIMAYGLLAILPMILGMILKEKHQLGMMRVGVVLNFAYILFIMIMQERIVDHLGILALLFGASTALFYYPHNIINGAKIDQKRRDNFELIKRTTISVSGVVVPFLLGLFITTIDFGAATGVILVLSLVQIGLTGFLTPVVTKRGKFQPWRAIKTFAKDKSVWNNFKMLFLHGMTGPDSAMRTLMPLLIYNAFQTDLDLGIITAVTNFLLVGVEYLYLKRWRGSKWVLTSLAVIPLVGLGVFLAVTNDATLVIYYVACNLMIGLMHLVMHVKLYNVSNYPCVRQGRRAEYWALVELAGGMGRILSHALLFGAGLLGMGWIYGVLAILTGLLVPMAHTASQIKDGEENDQNCCTAESEVR